MGMRELVLRVVPSTSWTHIIESQRSTRQGRLLAFWNQQQTLWAKGRKDLETLFHTVCAIEKKRSPDSEDLKMPEDRHRRQLQEEIDC